MPKGFDQCVRNNGKVRTMSGPDDEFGLTAGQYKHICIINGEIHQGHVKTKGKKK